MKLSVFKENNLLSSYDLSSEISEVNSAVTLYVGRADDSFIALDDIQISRDHAKLYYKNKKWFIEKLTIYSDIFINGIVLDSPSSISTNDIILIPPFIIKIDEDYSQLETITIESNKNIQDNSPEDVKFLNEKTETDIENELNDKINDPLNSTESLNNVEHDDNNLSEEESNIENFDESSTEEESLTEFPDESDDNMIENSFGSGFDDGPGDSTQVFRTFAKFSLELFGEFAPYDKFTLEDGETFIGRDTEKCQIILDDLEVSGVHAVIKKTGVSCNLTDLQSANGTLFKGERINRVDLENGSEFIIGGTTFTLIINSELVEEEKARYMPVESEQYVEVEEYVEVNADFSDQADKDALDSINGPEEKSIFKNPEKRKKLIYGVVGILLMYVLFGEDDSSAKKGKTKNQTNKSKSAKGKISQQKKKGSRKYSPSELEELESNYLISKEFIQTRKYQQAMPLLEKIFFITRNKDYKQSKMLYEMAKKGFTELEEIERKRKEDMARKERDLKIKDLVQKASKAVEEHKVQLAEALFARVLEMDPENMDIPNLKNMLDYWKQEQQRIALEKAQKKAERDRQINLLAPGKNFYIQKDWYNAILKLQPFLREKDIDEDLIKDATNLLSKSETNLKDIIAPLLGKARSLLEGQDLKGAYEHYAKILKYNYK